MASTLIRIASIGGGLATATGAGVGIAYLTSDSPQELEKIAAPSKEVQQTPAAKAIAAHLASINREIPQKAADNSRWNTQWGEFKKKYGATNDLTDPWKIEGWKDIKQGSNAPDKFKEKCIENGNKEIIKPEGDFFAQVKDYCSVEKVAVAG